ncbi:hypothetical protein V6N13_001854 [Hibiscus sabdariffa]
MSTRRVPATGLLQKRRKIKKEKATESAQNWSPKIKIEESKGGITNIQEDSNRILEERQDIDCFRAEEVGDSSKELFELFEQGLCSRE